MTEKNTPTLLEFSAGAATIQAAASSQPRISGLAYGGGIMTLAGHGEVAIDIDGMELSGSVPLLGDHKNELAAVLGAVSAAARNGKVLVDGLLSLANEAGQRVRQLARDGVPLQLSVGAEPTAPYREIRPGETFTVNGQTLTASSRGVKLFPATRLREVTVTPNGADSTTSVTIQGRKEEMIQDTGADALLAAYERIDAFADELSPDRVRSLKASARSGELVGAALDAEITSEVKAAFRDANDTAKLAELRASTPKAPSPNYGGRLNASVDTPTVLAAAWHIRNNEAEAEKCYPSHVLEAGRDLARAGSLCEMLRAAAVREGFTPPANAQEMLTASHGGFSTMSLPTTLGNVANKSAAAVFAEDLRPLLEMFPPASVSNLKEHTQIRMIDSGEMLPVGGDGEVKSNTVKESVYTLQADTYAAKTVLTRKAIINDDAGVFDTLTRTHTLKALRGIKNTMMKRWLDGSTFFTSGNKNLVTSNALSHAGLEAAMLKMRKQVDEEGRPIDIVPRYLFVPTELEHMALRLTRSDNFQHINNVADAVGIEPTGNAFNGLIVRTDPRLSNTSYSGYSLSSWYLIGSDPSLAPMKTVFLNGQRSPVIEVHDYASDINVLGYGVRVYMEWGAGFYEERSAVKSTA